MPGNRIKEPLPWLELIDFVDFSLDSNWLGDSLGDRDDDFKNSNNLQSFLTLPSNELLADEWSVSVDVGDGLVDTAWRASAACQRLCNAKRGPVPSEEELKHAGVPRRKDEVAEGTGYRSHLRDAVLESSAYHLGRPLHHRKDGARLVLDACCLFNTSLVVSRLRSRLFIVDRRWAFQLYDRICWLWFEP